MASRNPSFARLSAGYLFPEIARRRREFAAAHPEAKIISLGVGNTTEPLPPSMRDALAAEAKALGTREGYSGYGEDLGNRSLREAVARVWYSDRVDPEAISISDGAKPDLGRLALMFGPGATVAVQDPAYPVYVDASVIFGQAGKSAGGTAYEGISYLRCVPENDFFPDLSSVARTDLIYFCSPNNPTGAVATRRQLEALVAFAKANRSIILFDAAYAGFIRNPDLPRSIYEIEGADEVAIEVSSFSKFIGFTGVRLGWTVVPEALRYDDGTPVRNDWNRIVTTLFNGASNIAQAGGLAMFSDEGMVEMRGLVDFYLENAALIRKALHEAKFETWGGDNAPYIWTRIPGKTSWEAFAAILEKANVVTTPGSGFGSAGEGYLRVNAFGHREDVIEACSRISRLDLA
jgi:LL-diaminopimelate aminotransferase